MSMMAERSILEALIDIGLIFFVDFKFAAGLKHQVNSVTSGYSMLSNKKVCIEKEKRMNSTRSPTLWEKSTSSAMQFEY